MRKRVLIGFGITVVLASASGWVYWDDHHVKKVATPAKASKQVAAPAAKPLDPLEILAIRDRGYKASAITTTRSLGGQDGYTNAVVSFVSDGLIEYALQSTPDTPPPPGGYPVIILMHGYIAPTLYQTTGSDYRDYTAAWAKAGFVVVKPDYRGVGSSQGTATSGHYSPEYTYDMLNLMSSLKDYSLVNPKRIGIFGHSLGGHVAINTAVTSPDVKATVIANGVVGSMYDLFYNWPNSPAPNDQPTATVTSELQTLLAQHGTPKTNPDFYNAASAVNYVNFIKGPVQLHADTNDSTVPSAFSAELDAGLKKAGKTDVYYTYPGNDHQLSSQPTHAEVIQRTTAFFTANL